MRSFYYAYLRSDDWQARRLRMLALASLRDGMPRCESCTRSASPGNPLDVHHFTYERVGDEDDDDLGVLCRDCHRLAHLSPEMALFVWGLVRRRRLWVEARQTPIDAIDWPTVYTDPEWKQ